MTNRAHPPAWRFALLRVPYGVFAGVIRTALPYFLRSEGLTVERVGEIMAAITLPATLYFLWSPLTDFGVRRRTWLALAGVASAVGLGYALGAPRIADSNVLTLLFLAFAVSQLTSAAAGGLVTSVLPVTARIPIAGWYQAGNLGAGALAGGLVLLIAERTSRQSAALAAAVLIALPALSALRFAEPELPSRVPLGKRLREMLREGQRTFLTRRSALAVFLLAAPIGTGAAASLFAAMAPDYAVSGSQVGWINGLAGGVLLAFGALLGGLAPGRWRRESSYAAAGVTNAAASLFLFMAPTRPFAYFLGVAAYQLTTGICYACFAGLLFELLGEPGRSASSRYTLAVSLSNLPIFYMIWIEGFAHHAFGPHSVAALDAAGNLAVAAIVFAVMRLSAGRAEK